MVMGVNGEARSKTVGLSCPQIGKRLEMSAKMALDHVLPRGVCPKDGCLHAPAE